MSVLLKIAVRNLKEHKIKTLIVGMLIAMGVAVLVVGNSLMDSAAEGIRQAYTHSYTGDLIISGVHRAPMNLFGTQDIDGAALPVIPNYDDVYDLTTSHPDVTEVSPQATTLVAIHAQDAETVSYLFGIDPVTYQAMFPDNLELEQGRFLLPGEEGVVLNASITKALEAELEHPLQPGDTILLTGSSELSGIRVRQVTVRGVFRFVLSDAQMDTVSLVDIDTVRALAGMKLSTVSISDLTDIEAKLLGDFDEEALFGGDPDSLFAGALVEEADTAPTRFAPSTLNTLFAPDENELFIEEDIHGDSKAWHFLLVRLRAGASSATVRADLEALFAERGLVVQVSDWLEGAGPVATLTYGIKRLFNVVLIVIAVVAVIIIMNTLVISVTERTTEIGTMRALGAQKSLVRRMIALETLMLTGIFGAIGVVVGCGVLWVLYIAGLEAPNDFFEILFGGKVLRPVPSLHSIVMSMLAVAIVGIVSSLYPVAVALRTEPGQALQE